MHSTLRAYESFLKSRGTSLFANIALPETIDKQVLVNTIIDESEDKPVVYSDPYYTQIKIETFFASRLKNYERMSEMYDVEYNPIHNYNRTEEHEYKGDNLRTLNTAHTNETEYNINETLENSGTDKVNNTGTDTVTHTGTVSVDDTTTHTGTVETEDSTKRTGTVGVTDSTTHTGTTSTDIDQTETFHDNNTVVAENEVSAFNDDGYSPKAKTTTNTTYNQHDTVTDALSVVTNNLTDAGNSTTTNNLSDDSESTTTNNLTDETDSTTTSDLTDTTTLNNESLKTYGSKTETERNSTTSIDIADTGTIKDEDGHTEKIHAEGNIGVTETTTMLEHHVDFWRRINVYKIIAEDLVDTICMPIWI